MSRRLPQYLKQERRRAGYYQTDVAYLFGARVHGKVSRYERGRHLPPLMIALAYEALFGVPVAELFPGAFARARRAILKRAKRRLAAIAELAQTPRNVRRQRSLEGVIHRR